MANDNFRHSSLLLAQTLCVKTGKIQYLFIFAFFFYSQPLFSIQTQLFSMQIAGFLIWIKILPNVSIREITHFKEKPQRR